MIKSQQQSDSVENYVPQAVQSTTKALDERGRSLVINTTDLQEPSTSQTKDNQNPSEPSNTPTKFEDTLNSSIDHTDTCSESSTANSQIEDDEIQDDIEDDEIQDFSYQTPEDFFRFSKV